MPGRRLPSSFLLLMSVLSVGCTRPAKAWFGRYHAAAPAVAKRSATVLMMSSTTTSSDAKVAATNIDKLLHGKRLVSVEDCISVHSADGQIQFLDGSWFLKDRNGREEFETGPRIPGAHYFDIDDVASKPGSDGNPKGLPHMMPPASLFASVMDQMNITNSHHLILYATKGCMMVHRALFQIQAYGHDRDRIHLMDGSLSDWEDAGGPLDTETTKAIKATLSESKTTQYTATGPHQVVDMADIQQIIDSDSGDIIVDVRAPDRFLGQVEEPRPGLRLGHMPGAKNLFFYNLLDVPDNVERFKSKEEMTKLIEEAGIDIATDGRIVISCGSGATACALATALDICGRDPSKTFVYDGSWVEWGSEPDTPIVTTKEEK